MKKYKQGIAAGDKDVKFTIDELLSIFKEESKNIWKKSDEVLYLAEGALNDYIERNRKYVRFI